MAAGTLALRPRCRPIPRVLLDKHFLRKHGPHAYYGQPVISPPPAPPRPCRSCDPGRSGSGRGR
jgi:hypothetical protein